ncbi:SusC/RagA family TonB-linked outer membrane protein [Bacteroidia bacterium]|nr:SusC/RagA family TonB-linked outer membrane protein [Bacteroidia bacterium]
MTAQTNLANGIVVDDGGEPLIGVSVVVKGTTQGTATGNDGSFKLNLSGNQNVLVISMLGYRTIEQKAGSDMRIILQMDEQLLDELIVVAYGTTKRSSFTGSASTVGEKNLDKRPLTSFASALEGNVSGIQVTSGTGQPGESPTIRVRGFGSVNASNSPLYVVDGMVFNGNSADINPADIDQITILKDAASTSLYGSSAGNGVVLITTKKGSKSDGGSKVSLNINQGWSNRAYNDYDRVGIMDYYPLQWEMLKNANISTGRSAEEAAQTATNTIVNTVKYNPFAGIADNALVGTDGRLNSGANTLKWGDDLDWDNAAFRTGYRQDYLLSYNSATDKSDTYSSIGYLKDNGYLLRTDYERYSARINHNIHPVKWFDGGVNVAFSKTKSNFSTSTSDNSSGYGNLVAFTRGMAPIYPIHSHDLTTGAYLTEDGKPTTNPDEYIYDYQGQRLSSTGRHAIAETLWNMRENGYTNFNGRTFVSLKPMDGLSFKIEYGLDNNDRRRKQYENPKVGDGQSGPGRLNILSTRQTTQNFNQILNYTKSFGNHNLEAMLGHENYEWKFEYMYGMKLGESFSELYEFGNFTDISSLSSYTDLYRKEGYFGRLNYNYDGKYYGSLSYRHDGSSRFRNSIRWGDFWSFGAAWRISEENFMKDISWVDNLKLRASYGETGNDGILDLDNDPDYYPYQTLFNTGVNNASESGVFFSVVANPDLTWETQVSIDAAIEFGFFKHLTGSVEFFDKESRDLLYPESVPISTGVPSIIRNIGKVRNLGLEIILNYDIFKHRDYRANVGLNLTFIKNRIVKLPEANKKEGKIDGTKKLYEGKSRYEFWLRQWYGVDPATGNGLYYLDTEKYETSTDAQKEAIDKTIVDVPGVSGKLTNAYANAKYDFSGDAIPNAYGGISLGVGYKSFDLNALFSFQLGGKMLDYNYQDLMSLTRYGYAMASDIKDRWQQPGDITSVPRLDNNSTHATNVNQVSTQWLTNSDYLNFRSINLSYTLPASLIQSMQLKTVRVSASVENIFMLKARQGLNPMANFTGLTYNEYMPTRNFTLGLNVTF